MTLYLMTAFSGGPRGLAAVMLAVVMLAIAGTRVPREGCARVGMTLLAIQPAANSAGTAAKANSSAAGEEGRAVLLDAGGSGTALWNCSG